MRVEWTSLWKSSRLVVTWSYKYLIHHDILFPHILWAYVGFLSSQPITRICWIIFWSLMLSTFYSNWPTSLIYRIYHHTWLGGCLICWEGTWVRLFLQVLGTPTREEIKCMNPNYTEFKFPQIKAHPWHKVWMTYSIGVSWYFFFFRMCDAH